MSPCTPRIERLSWLWVAAVLASACTPAEARRAQHATVIRPSAIEAHMRYLASDLMEGREAGTRGYDLAAGYVASAFQQLGLRPAGAPNSYLQPVPLQTQRLVRDGVRMVVRPTGGRATRLVLGRDFVVSSSATRASSVVNAPAVFVGYGIEAPALKHNDYEGLDVSGKVVVMLSGYPLSFPSEEGAHYSSEKGRSAAAQGAIGTLTIYTERDEKVFPFDLVAERIDSIGMSWIAPDGKPFVKSPAVQVDGLMSPAAAERLFTGAPRSYQAVRSEAADGAPKGFPLQVSVEIAQASKHDRRSSANVAAVLEGSDPALRDEYVVLVAHLDHDGIGPPVKEDRIYNGALDNAAGVAALLEAARALAGDQPVPRRSVLFLAVTAEEKGMLGSEYFARHPTIPRDAMVAAISLDMPVLLYDFTDVIAFGAQHSSLKAVLETALKQVSLTLTPDPMPEQAIFVRSDHYRFVEQGVPSILLATGWNSTKGAGEGGKVFLNFFATNYHRPSDDMNQPIDFTAGARFADVNYRILKAIANGDSRPSWNPGNFFGTRFGAGR